EARLDQHAAFEVDPVIEADREEQCDRHYGEDRGECHADLVKPHEIDGRRVPDDNQRSHSGISFGFQRLSQVTIRSRVTRIAENSEVRTPMLSVTANPFTGPDPSQ